MSIGKTIYEISNLIHTLEVGSEAFVDLDLLVKDYYSQYSKNTVQFGSIELEWKRTSLGNLDSFTFFSLPELMLYRYYQINKNKYNLNPYTERWILHKLLIPYQKKKSPPNLWVRLRFFLSI